MYKINICLHCARKTTELVNIMAASVPKRCNVCSTSESCITHRLIFIVQKNGKTIFQQIIFYFPVSYVKSWGNELSLPCLDIDGNDTELKRSFPPNFQACLIRH